MSYEGVYEYICERGHYFSLDCNDSFNPKENNCPYCDNPVEYFRSVDYTNGNVDGEPGTKLAELSERGYEDSVHLDVAGNKYIQRTTLVKPVDESLWRKVDDSESVPLLASS